MRVVSEDLITGKKVLIRADLDVPLQQVQGKLEVAEDFRLRAILPTIELCLHHSLRTTIIGHIGRPEGKNPKLTVAPIVSWLEENLDCPFEEGKLLVMENLRFDIREEKKDEEFAKELASDNEIFINEAFAAHHPSSSTTILPKLLPSAAGLRFAKEVEVLKKVRKKPQRPLVVIIGGAKIEDKYPAVLSLAKLADAVLVGGLLAKEIKEEGKKVPKNVMVGKLSDTGLDLADETIDSFINLLKNAREVVWSGPVGQYESPSGKKGNQLLADAIISFKLESIIGGGDTIAALKQYLTKFSFVSTGGGAMLKFLTDGSLPTIEVLM